MLALLSGTALALVPRFSVLERALTAAVVAYAQLVGTLLLCGTLLHSFAAGTILAVNTVCTVLVIGLVGRRFRLRGRFSTVWHALARFRLPAPAANRFRDAWVWALAALTAAEVIFLALAAYVLPPVQWDSLSYHLPAVATWIRANDLVTSPLSGAGGAYPMNGELGFLWVGALSRSDLLVDAVPILFAVLGGVAVVTIARTVGVSRPSALAAGALFFLTPIVLAQAASNYVDVVLAGLYLAGFALLLRALHDMYRRGTLCFGARLVPLLALAGLAIGLAAGSKASGPLYAGVAILVVAVNLLLLHRSRRISGRLAAASFLVILAPVLVVGSFWYLRTWINYGNPLYPSRVEFAGVTMGSGPQLFSKFNPPPPQLRNDSAPVRVAKSWLEQTHTVAYDQRIGGFGLQWPLLEIPALVVFTVLMFARRRWLVLGSFVAPLLLIFALTPDKWWSRYYVVLVAPGVIAVVFVIEQLRGRRLRATLQAITVICAALGCGFTLTRPSVLGRTFRPDEVVSKLATGADERTISALVLPEYRWTERIPRDSRIGVDRADVPFGFVYSLFGSDFRNDVVALADRDSDAELLRTIRRLRLDYVFTRSGASIDRLARSHPRLFTLSSRSGDTRVYRYAGL